MSEIEIDFFSYVFIFLILKQKGVNDDVKF